MTTIYENQVQELYIAYFGRAADPEGLAFYAGALSVSSTTIEEIASSFANSSEAQSIVALSTVSFLNEMYQQAFARHYNPGTDGLFWENAINSGATTKSLAMVQILQGAPAGSQDAVAVANKVSVASFFTTMVDANLKSYPGKIVANENTAVTAKAILDGVTADALTIATGIAKVPAAVKVMFGFAPSTGGEQLPPNSIVGTNGVDRLEGGAENNFLFGRDGDDILRGGGGVDSMDGGDGDDRFVIVGDISGGGKIDSPEDTGVLGFPLTDLNFVDRNEDADGGAEIIIGGDGNDTLYVYGTADLSNYDISGIEHIVIRSDVTFLVSMLQSIQSLTGDGNSIVRIQASPGELQSLDLSQVQFSQIGHIDLGANTELVISAINELGGAVTLSGSGDITVTNDELVFTGIQQETSVNARYSDGSFVDGAALIESIVFGDGSATITGTNGNDYIQGTHITETIIGGNGSDIILGSGGHDTIWGDLDPDSTHEESLVTDPLGYDLGNNELVNGLGGTAGFGENVLHVNDDGSSAAIDITSVFGEAGLDFFGTNYTSLYVNNNGNITFSNPLSTYTPGVIDGGIGNPIIAPFWADVDTRGSAPNTPTAGGNSTGSNRVWYDLDEDNKVFTVTWDDVGYYPSQVNKLNAFQLQLVNLEAGAFDIIYRYENIDWTTGSASGGSGGLGGTVARVGYSAGNSVHFDELSQSGNQAAILALDEAADPYLFQVRNGIALTTANDDVINGGDGNDTIIGGKGDDTIEGGSGEEDVAVFTGNYDEYVITEYDTYRTVSDTVANRDGVDTVYNDVEVLRFSSTVPVDTSDYINGVMVTGGDASNEPVSTTETVNLDANRHAHINGYTGLDGDIFDYYKFETNISGFINFSLTGLNDDLNLNLFDSSGDWVATSQNAGTSDESILFNIIAGNTYYIQTMAFDVESSYDLSIDEVTDDYINGVIVTGGDASNERVASTNIDIVLDGNGAGAVHINGYVGLSADIKDNYKFTAITSGLNTITLSELNQDLDLRLSDSSGTSIAERASLGASNEVLSFDATAGSTYYIEVLPSLSSESSYDLSIETLVDPLWMQYFAGVTPVAGSMEEYIMPLISTDIISTNTNPWPNRDIKYFYNQRADDAQITGGTLSWTDSHWFSDDTDNIAIEAIERALDSWATVANVTFTKTTVESEANFNFYLVSPTWMDDNLDSSTFAGFALGAGVGGGDDGWQDGDMVLKNASSWNDGERVYSTIVHELGHSLGLQHPHFDGFDDRFFPGLDPNVVVPDLSNLTDAEEKQILSDYYDDISAERFTIGDLSLNQGLYTIESYNRTVTSDGINTFSTRGEGITPITPMALDIAAIQMLYGANNNYQKDPNNPNDIYDLNDTYTDQWFTGDLATWSSIWDTGGTADAIIMTGNYGVSIDLRAADIDIFNLRQVATQEMGGYISKINPLPFDDKEGGYTIAHGVEIENAIGGGGSDTIHGNSLDNRIEGGLGIDTLTGAGGADKFIFRSLDNGVNIITGLKNGGDTITDFATGIDQLEFTIDQFIGFDLGSITSDRLIFGSNPTAIVESLSVFLFDTDTNTLSFDRDGTDPSGFDFPFARLKPSPFRRTDLSQML